MRCPVCQSENPSGMSFCGKCGAPLVSRCTKCSFENPPAFKFCGQCTAPFGIGAKSLADEAEVRGRARALGLSSEKLCL